MSPPTPAEPRAPATVSIGLPIYNGARTMRRTLDALLGQTFTDFSVLLSDNASTDDTEAIGREYAERDPRVRYVRQPVNLGAIGNFLYVFEHSRGPYYSWLACDDFYDTPTHLDRLRERLDAGDALAFPNVNHFDLLPDGSVSPRRRDAFGHFRAADSRVAMTRLAIRGTSHQLYGMFRREVVARYLPYLAADATWACFNEARFLHWVFSRERCSFVNEESLNVCHHTGAVSRNVRPLLLLRDYLRLNSLIPAIYADADYSPADKLRLLGDLGRANAPYLGYLAARSVPAAAVEAWSWITSRPSRR
ncbi:MAG: glycosyltransferase family 2 protein [Deltaproteobacteria bacterium]|jgi:glycosyltransferase involved in cell wall biosynthesis|nr:glycosyltransferase family 2 protein [Deltaproteobacteria bacterium]MBK8696663.1 glycosyltransferase family 2 protein [Deltaproteobacteria bacterium]MBP6829784.1 glycosyltransferase family 2 protein [Deltaproteobacteria bacterium]